MDIDQYLELIAGRLRRCREENDAAEFVRLLTVLRDTVDELIAKTIGSDA